MSYDNLSSEETWAKWLKQMRRLPIRFRLTRLPIIGKHLFRNSFVGDPTTKAWLLPVQEEVPVPDSVHLPLDVLKPLITKSAHRAIPARCICRSAFLCETFPQDFGCLLLGSVFGEADQVGMELLSVEQAIAHAERAVSLGLVPTIIWEQENQTLTGGARDKGLAVCFCCDCCCDYRLGLRVGSKAFKKKVFRPEGVSVVVSDDCVLCGSCAEPEVCCVHAVTLGPARAQIDLEKCVGCGQCIQICPEGAIAFQLDPEVDIVGRLLAQVEAITDVT